MKNTSRKLTLIAVLLISGSSFANDNELEYCEKMFVVSKLFNNGHFVTETRMMHINNPQPWSCSGSSGVHYQPTQLRAFWSTRWSEVYDINALSILNIKPVENPTKSDMLVLKLDEAHISQAIARIRNNYPNRDAPFREVIDILNLAFSLQAFYDDVRAFHVQAERAKLLEMGFTEAVLNGLNGEWRPHD